MSSRLIMSTVRKIVCTPKAGMPLGAYSQAVVVDKTMYLSGQIPLNPETGQVVPGGASEQAIQVLQNMKAILEAGGSSIGSVVKTTILLADIKDWPSVNGVYSKYFFERQPARAAYQVAALPVGALVEMEAIAVVGEIKDE